jgi:hypothetical protein
MMSVRKRAAGIAAATALLATAGPVSLAAAATAPAATPAPVSTPYQVGAAAALAGWNAGADAAVGGFNAGLTALGLPFQFTANTWAPFGLHIAGLAPLTASH